MAFGQSRRQRLPTVFVGLFERDEAIRHVRCIQEREQAMSIARASNSWDESEGAGVKTLSKRLARAARLPLDLR
jgi:hypothetical protein